MHTENTKNLIELKDLCIKNIFKEEKMICNYRKFDEELIVEIGPNGIILINVNQTIEQTCNEYTLKLTGIYALQVENCEVKIDKRYDKGLHQDSIIIPNYLRNIEILENDVTLEELHYKHIENTLFMKELKANQKTHNGTLYLTISILSCILTAQLYCKLKKKLRKYTNISIDLPQFPL